MPELTGLKICFLAGTLGQGGTERQLFYMVRALQHSGATVSVLCLARGEFWEHEIRRLGIPVIWVGRRRSRLARLLKIISVLAGERPHVIQSQHFYINLYAVVAARVLGLREVGSLRGEFGRELGFQGWLIGRLNLMSPRTLILNSLAALQGAAAWGIPVRRLHMLPNVVDLDQFRPRSARPPGPVRILAVGRMSREKGFDRLLLLLADVRARCTTRFRVTLLGDGPEREALEEKATRLGLVPGIVEFRGAVAAAAPVFREADIMVLTSVSEGTPNVVLEAMASGLPVVATRTGGVPEIVNDSVTGFLALPDDERSFVRSLIRLIEDESLRTTMGERGRLAIERSYSLERLPNRLEKIYEAARG